MTEREATQPGDIYNILQDLNPGAVVRWNADGRPVRSGRPHGTVTFKDTVSFSVPTEAGRKDSNIITVIVKRFDTGGREHLFGVKLGRFRLLRSSFPEKETSTCSSISQKNDSLR